MLSKSVTSSEIASVISKTTGIPLERMLESEKDKLLGMNKELQKMVIGQNDAIEKISSAVLRSKSWHTKSKQTNWYFFIFRPTGVGKTELCKALSKFLSMKKNHFTG